MAYICDVCVIGLFENHAAGYYLCQQMQGPVKLSFSFHTVTVFQ